MATADDRAEADSLRDNDRFLVQPHSVAIDEVLALLHSSRQGLSESHASERLALYGPNTLPSGKPPGMLVIFFRQFKSPLIYILLAAALLSAVTTAWSDAVFITAILLLNAIIGSIQEYSAQRATEALQKIVTARARVLRDGQLHDKDASVLVPGDVVALESGDRVPADLRLFTVHDTVIDESLLTGESVAVSKKPDVVLVPMTPPGDRCNMAFAGTMVERGRAWGVVVNTGLATEIGRIATHVLLRPVTKSPLLLRMERFTRRVAVFVGVAAMVVALISIARGTELAEIFFLAVALAVSAIPEGLPVALTVALAIGLRRMANRNVIVRRLISVEALGSCTCIATDKTGTLTVNRITVKRVELADGSQLEVAGEGIVPSGRLTINCDAPGEALQVPLSRLARASVLSNEAQLMVRDGEWTAQGDAVDVALLVMAHKLGMVKEKLAVQCPEIDTIPFESEHMFSASVNRVEANTLWSVKGAPETILSMCSAMAVAGGDLAIDRAGIQRRAEALAAQGYRMLAVAEGQMDEPVEAAVSERRLSGLTFLGLLGMVDPLRPESAQAVASCQQAGIRVVMVTGDHPITALAVARQLQLADDERAIVTGADLKLADSEPGLDRLTESARVYARAEPVQKLEVVKSLQRHGHFVAVSGDGANDAPALKAAQVGVAMGASGTEVARETADLIITDDNFSSILAGVEEGRVAYSNVRKVIFLLISTGAAELVLFTLALITGTPLPLMAVQLLWLNLVTNGIQDIALAFEPAEGNELSRPPRPPNEAIFNRVMIERVAVSALTIGGIAFVLFQWLLMQGYSIEEARNGTLLLMVLFENVQVFNSRSETLSVFRHNPLRNPLLLFGTLAAQLIHIGSMYTPGLSSVLQVQPVSFVHWSQLLLLALLLLVVMEVHKAVRGQG
ncbi:cation-translocating P-type ATPase [Ferrimonas kyonanensis]|uniref:cation-translocating P-type ATPase n=1 Tax=Ferrimonas kyonanensis TaxID=364763 RepID=UPI000418C096|nr:HAD-IC family P-type ATPase [Ferrimonas kyonanensis]